MNTRNDRQGSKGVRATPQVQLSMLGLIRNEIAGAENRPPAANTEAR